MKHNYKVLESNGGGIELFVFDAKDSKKVIYHHTGYDYRSEPDGLLDDIAALENENVDVLGWDGCEEGDIQTAYDNWVNSTDCNESALIADNEGVYYDNMGGTGLSIFGRRGEGEKFVYKGKVYRFIQDAYLSGDHYEAAATDEEENEYSVYWDILEDFDPKTDDDESYACDWMNPSCITDEYGYVVGTAGKPILVGGKKRHVADVL